MKKHIITFLVVISLCFSIRAQGTITNITISPASPVALVDTIYMYVDLQFPNSGCGLDTLSHSVVGQNIIASTHHCVGMLTSICNITDTFKIDPLAAGIYLFDLTLTSGAAPAPCTPGFAIDDSDTISFEVIDIVSLDQQTQISPQLFPNPSSNSLILNYIPDNAQRISIYAHNGKLVRNCEISTIINVSDLSNGIYYLSIVRSDSINRYRFVKSDN